MEEFLDILTPFFFPVLSMHCRERLSEALVHGHELQKETNLLEKRVGKLNSVVQLLSDKLDTAYQSQFSSSFIRRQCLRSWHERLLRKRASVQTGTSYPSKTLCIESLDRFAMWFDRVRYRQLQSRFFYVWRTRFYQGRRQRSSVATTEPVQTKTQISSSVLVSQSATVEKKKSNQPRLRSSSLSRYSLQSSSRVNRPISSLLTTSTQTEYREIVSRGTQIEQDDIVHYTERFEKVIWEDQSRSLTVVSDSASLNVEQRVDNFEESSLCSLKDTNSPILDTLAVNDDMIDRDHIAESGSLARGSMEDSLGRDNCLHGSDEDGQVCTLFLVDVSLSMWCISRASKQISSFFFFFFPLLF